MKIDPHDYTLMTNDALMCDPPGLYAGRISFWVCAGCGIAIPAINTAKHNYRENPPNEWGRRDLKPKKKGQLHYRWLLCPACMEEEAENER